MAVPIDGEDDDWFDRSIEWSVSLDSERHADNFRVSLIISNENDALAIAAEILNQLRHRKGESIELELTGHVFTENFQFEELTEQEAEVVYKRWQTRVNEE